MIGSNVSVLVLGISSLAHEFAHIARRDLFDRTIPEHQRAGVTDADIETVWEWAGVKDGDWTVEAEEKFARGLERYIRDGKAPNERLVPLFEKLAQWMRAIYDNLRGSSIKSEISREMRAVFDALMSREQYLRQNGRRAAQATA